MTDDTNHATLQAWARHQQAQGLAKNTIYSRLRTLQTLANHHPLLTLTTDDLLAWITSQTWSRASRATHRSTLKAFFGWAHGSGKRADNPMAGVPSVRRPAGLPRPASMVEIKRYLRVAKTPVRDYVVLATFAGLRVHEIAKVRHDDVDDDRLRVTGKGGLVAYVPLAPQVADIVDGWPRLGWVFPHRHDQTRHVEPKRVSAVVAEDLRRHGINATAHQLRHTFGTRVLRTSGGNVRVAQKALRHSHISSTAIYTAVDDDAVRDAVSKIDDD